MTGRSWRLAGGGYTAEVLEAGGGLATLAHRGRPLVAGPDPDRAVTGGRGQVLMPWPNRIRDGRYSFAGETRQLALSEPAYQNAIHGLVRWSAWQPTTVTGSHVRLECRLVAQSGYPWTLDLSAEYDLSAEGLRIDFTAHNRSSSAAPFAAGMHPYFDVGGPVDGVELRVPAAVHLDTDDRQLPSGTGPAEGDLDFRRARLIGAQVLDDAFTDLARDEAGWAVVRLARDHAVELHVDSAWRWIQVFTGDTLSDGARRSLAVEPMTAPPDAFNSGTDLVVLEPDQQWQGRLRITEGAGPSAP